MCAFLSVIIKMGNFVSKYNSMDKNATMKNTLTKMHLFCISASLTFTGFLSIYISFIKLFYTVNI